LITPKAGSVDYLKDIIRQPRGRIGTDTPGKLNGLLFVAWLLLGGPSNDTAGGAVVSTVTKYTAVEVV